MAQQFDTSVPKIGRVYDFWLGGPHRSQPARLPRHGRGPAFLDAVAAAEVAAGYARLLAPGSYVIITVGRGDGEVADRFFSR